MKQLVTFKEMRAQDVHLEWEQLNGVQLVVEAAGKATLMFEIDRQLEDAADYQLNSMDIEAAYQAEWTDDSGRIHVRELVPASMWGAVE